VPHTWQTLGRSPDYIGVAWYRTEIFAPIEWRTQFVRVEFEAVSHTATVYLNGKQIGEHKGKPYTSFIFDVSGALQYGKLNMLLVRVDNTYSETMLPRAKSYDWANDGGIIRPVSILLTPPVFIERIEIDAAPNSTRKTAAASIRQDGTSAAPKLVEPVSRTVAPASSVIIALPEVEIASPALWHFDKPQLYTGEAQLRGVVHEHTVEDTFGIRRFETKGAEFFLNGERVFLIGVERMAGSILYRAWRRRRNGSRATMQI
jgi:beta-galactosidase